MGNGGFRFNSLLFSVCCDHSLDELIVELEALDLGVTHSLDSLCKLEKYLGNITLQINSFNPCPSSCIVGYKKQPVNAIIGFYGMRALSINVNKLTDLVKLSSSRALRDPGD